MELRQLQHFGVFTTRLEDSLTFYERTLGLKRYASEALDEFTVHKLRSNEDFFVELLELPPDQRTDEVEPRHPDQWTPHVAIEVEGLDSWSERITAIDVNIVRPRTHFAQLGCTVFLFSDPNGVIIELIEEDRSLSAKEGRDDARN